MANKGKHPKKAASPPGKTVRAGGDPESFLKECPVWKVDAFDVDGPWGKCEMDIEEVWSHILPKMKSYESMTWGEIDRNRWYNHFVAVSAIAKEAQDRILSLRLDVDQLFRFRLGSLNRLWGIRDRNIFRILWWDPDHKIYPTEPKNT